MKVTNRTVHREFELLENIEAGIVLTGAEVKAIKAGSIKLENAFVKLINGELYLVNAEVPIYKYARPENYDSARSRKLLVHKKEIVRWQTKIAGSGNLTIVPISCYNKKHNIKLEIALAKGRKGWQIKRIEQKRDEQRRVEKEMKERMKV